MIVFYADEDVPFPLVKALRLQGITINTTGDHQMLGKTDEEQLQTIRQKATYFSWWMNGFPSYWRPKNAWFRKPSNGFTHFFDVMLPD